MAELKSYAAWDAPTRWFHWINALCVIGLAALGLVILNDGGLGISNAGKVALKTVHMWVGYVFALNLLWRFVLDSWATALRDGERSCRAGPAISMRCAATSLHSSQATPNSIGP